MKPRAILAIDQGTTSTKAFVLHTDGRFFAIGNRTHQTFYPQDGHVEQDAEELIGNIQSLIEQAFVSCDVIDGIALANQGETVVAFDRLTGRALHRALVWQDQRTQGWLDSWADQDKAFVTSHTGLPLDAYFSASKLRWLLLNCPAVVDAQRAGQLGLATSDSFFLHRLTGLYATDVTTASRTSLMDLQALQWSGQLAKSFDIETVELPQIRPTMSHFGVVRCGQRDIPVYVSVVDQQAALFGHGCRKAGDAKITFGTGSFALALTGSAPILDREGLVPTVAWQHDGNPAFFALDGGDYTASAAVDWLRETGLANSLADFDFADAHPAALRNVFFVPALAGLAAPYWRRDAAAGFFGLRMGMGADVMRKAVLEGIAFRGAELADALDAKDAPISIDGGLTKNSYFVQCLADCLGRPVLLQAEPDLTALGAAQMAFSALGVDVVMGHRPVRLVEPGPHSVDMQARRVLFSRAVQASLAMTRLK
jgi:glycerol kinase